MKFTLALAQIATKLGDVDANLEKHLAYIREAKAQGADLVVFPELSLTGYVVQDLTPWVARRPQPDDPTFGPLLEASRHIDLVVGFVDEDVRSRFFIAAAYLSGGEVVHVHHKVYLPTYGLFDEGRFFAWGDAVRAFDTRFGRMGILICEDFWHASPPYLLWLDGADVLIFVSASPGRGLGPELEIRAAASPLDTETARRLPGGLGAGRRWSTGRAQRPGDSLTLDLGRVARLGWVELDNPDFPRDYPRGLKALVSVEGKRWRESPLHLSAPLCFSGQVLLACPGRRNLYRLARPLKGRYLRLVCTAGDPSCWWSLQRVRVLSAAGGP